MSLPLCTCNSEMFDGRHHYECAVPVHTVGHLSDYEALRLAAENLIQWCDIEMPYWLDAFPDQEHRWHEYQAQKAQVRSLLRRFREPAPA